MHFKPFFLCSIKINCSNCIGKKRKPKMKRIAQLPTGNIAFESSETQLEETILIGSISKIHTQLRRKLDIITCLKLSYHMKR